MREFSLIEMLMVIAIIGILVSLLLASLSKTREAGKNTVCANNMRQIGIALNVYSTSFDDGISIPDAFTDLLVGNGILYAPRDMAFNGNINVEVTKESTVFKCPSGLDDRLSKNMQDDVQSFIDLNEALRPWRSWAGVNGGSTNYITTQGGYDNWYGVVGTAANKGGWGQWRFNNWRVSNANHTWPRIERITDPAKGLMLHDGSYFIHTYSGGANPGHISARHMDNKKTNLLFFDGHVISSSYSAVVASRESTPATNNKIVWKAVQGF
ncbi:MAG: prepilin-type N-terminal cleavage/methylation domain-containing protein [Lentisphaerales bacterium]|nr:prepilin-type N-terminal cleavage/methylation domain-containing protein [Lentisphaerales bacterium]